MDKKIPLESVIVKGIMKCLKDTGYQFFYKSHGNAYARTGLPDIIVIARNGRFVGLECKRPKIGKVTALQAKILNEINDAGGYGAVVHSVEEARAIMMAAEADDIITGRFIAE